MHIRPCWKQELLGVPDAFGGGEVPQAYVVLPSGRAPSVNESQLIDFMKSRLPGLQGAGPDHFH